MTNISKTYPANVRAAITPLNPTLFELRGCTIFYDSREIFTLGTADDAFHYFTALRNGDTTVAGSIGRLHEQQAKQGPK